MIESLVIVSVFGGLLLLAAWLTSTALGLQRIGYGGSLFIGLWLVLSLGYAMPFDWSALVGDLSLILTALVLFLIQFKFKSQKKHFYQKTDFAMFALFLLALSLIAAIIPVPFDTDAQGFGYIALCYMRGGDLTTLAPLHPEINVLYAPGFLTLTAYLSERLHVSLHSTQIGISIVFYMLTLMNLYDFGLDLKNRKLARCIFLAATIGTGLFTAFMDSHYTTIQGLAFGSCFLFNTYRIIIAKNIIPSYLFACCMLAALVLSHPDSTIIIALGYGGWLLLTPFARPRISFQRWCLLTFALPACTMILLMPWFITVLPLLGSGIASPFTTHPWHLMMIFSIPPHIIYQGGMIVLFSLAGLCLWIRKRRHPILLSIGWLIFVIEFSALGLLERILPFLIEPIAKYHYPFSIAWHGPIIPFSLLAGYFLYSIHRQWSHKHPNIIGSINRFTPWLLASCASCLLLGGIFHQQVIDFTKERVHFYGTFATHNDVKAMKWLRENTDKNEIILNHPGPHETFWVPVVSERRCVYYRSQPFFSNKEKDTKFRQKMLPFWHHPADNTSKQLLLENDIRYVIVPELIANPDVFKDMFRSREPFTKNFKMKTSVRDAEYLTLVYESGDARIYRMK